MRGKGILAILAMLCGVAAAPATAAAPSSATVTARDIDFHPSTVTVRKGGTVTWRFVDDPAPHNVTSRGTKRFRSSQTKLSGTYRVRFTRAGTYRYICTIHPNMDGQVRVR